MEQDKLKLKTGRELYCNVGFIGINEKLSIAQGYDGGLPLAPNDPNYEYDEDKLSKEEAKELADIMIDRWNKFKIACE